jgi:hypothetical protein
MRHRQRGCEVRARSVARIPESQPRPVSSSHPPSRWAFSPLVRPKHRGKKDSATDFFHQTQMSYPARPALASTHSTTCMTTPLHSVHFPTDRSTGSEWQLQACSSSTCGSWYPSRPASAKLARGFVHHLEQSFIAAVTIVCTVTVARLLSDGGARQTAGVHNGSDEFVLGDWTGEGASRVRGAKGLKWLVARKEWESMLSSTWSASTFLLLARVLKQQPLLCRSRPKFGVAAMRNFLYQCQGPPFTFPVRLPTAGPL